MGFFSLGRVITAFFNQLFRWLFWNKTGQKILFILVIAFIFVIFIKLGEVSAAEPSNLDSYIEISSDGVLSNSIITGGLLRISSNDSFVIEYLEINPYNYYSFIVKTGSSNPDVRLAFSNSISLNSSIYDFEYPGNVTDYSFSFDGSTIPYKYFLVCYNVSGGARADVSYYYQAFPNRVSTLSSVNSFSLNTSTGFSYDGSTHYYYAFPVHEGFSYRILGVNTLTPMFYFSDIGQFNVLSSYDNRLPSGFTGTNISGYMSGSITYSGSNFAYDQRNGVFNYTYINSSGKFDFVSPFDGWFVFEFDYNSIPSIYTDYSGVDKPVTTTNSNINNVNSSINNLNDSITDSNISDNDSDYILPESGVTDIAESGFANIFDKLRVAFTSESSGQGLVVNVPFTDKSFTISKNSVFGNVDLGIVGTLINSFWYFIVSLWIVKDIAHKMNMIKSGNIELSQTTNIKEDLL